MLAAVAVVAILQAQALVRVAQVAVVQEAIGEQLLLQEQPT
jgi:hypothetical protein